MIRNLLVSILLSMGFTAFAKNSESYECKMKGAANRKVEINYLAEDKKVPCEVVYTNHVGSKKVYDAKIESGYCEKQTESFLQKLGNEGWKCEKAETVVPAAQEVKQEAAPAEAPAPSQEVVQ